MTVLTNQSIQLTYGNVLTLENEQNLGLTGVLQYVQDGYGHSSPLQIATNNVNIDNVFGTFSIGGIPLTSSVAQINNITSTSPILLGTSGVVIPVGNKDQRPPFPIIGTLRFNSETGNLELYNGASWLEFQTI